MDEVSRRPTMRGRLCVASGSPFLDSRQLDTQVSPATTESTTLNPRPTCCSSTSDGRIMAKPIHLWLALAHGSCSDVDSESKTL